MDPITKSANALVRNHELLDLYVVVEYTPLRGNALEQGAVFGVDLRPQRRSEYELANVTCESIYSATSATVMGTV